MSSNQLQLFPANTLVGGTYCTPNAMPDRIEALADFGVTAIQLGDSKTDVTAIVDTGAGATIINHAAARALGLRLDGSDANVQGSDKATAGLGGEGTGSTTSLTTLPMATRNGWHRDAMQVRIVDLPVFEVTGLGNTPAIILGYDALKGSIIDVTAHGGHVCIQTPSDHAKRH